MTMTPIDPEPNPPVSADWVADWEEHPSGLHRYYCEAERLGVKVVGYQNWDGTERPRTVYLRGVGDLTTAEAEALSRELSEAVRRV